MDPTRRKFELTSSTLEEFDRMMGMVRQLAGVPIELETSTMQYKGVLLAAYAGNPNSGLITLEFNINTLSALASVAGDESVLVDMRAALQAGSRFLN